MKYLFSLIAIVVLFCCQTQKMESKYSTIEYKAGACFGSCPIFKITIHQDKTAVFEAEHFNFSKGFNKSDFNKPREGTFRGNIKEKDYKKLIALIDGLDIKTMNDKYGRRNITDMATSYVRIKFADGSSKEVEDYGKNGSPKLVEVYNFLEDLRTNQDWKKVD
ncbi:DUF6438 domain-containing protein [Chryseobacterium sp.]|uniref:DUF6438 domain-containing protein n=1 Tax=Chryseobacterium sp. TaxID=1871047 RepID=UPI002FC7E2A5